MKPLSRIVLILIILCLPAVASAAPSLLSGLRWAPDVKHGINELLLNFGRHSGAYNPASRPYAVLDFDHTVSMTDIGRPLAVYQLEHLRFNINPILMQDVLTSGLSDINADLGAKYRHLSITKVVSDAASAYTKLFIRGLVSIDGSKVSDPERLKGDLDWAEFATKMLWLLETVRDIYGEGMSSSWQTYWFTGMTPSDVSALAEQAFRHFRQQEHHDTFWKPCRLACPTYYPGRQAGQLSVTVGNGMSVPREMHELIEVLTANGIDVWIASPSASHVVNAALSAYGLTSMVKGVLALSNNMQNGRYINSHDETFHSKSYGIGKADNVERLLAPLYHGKGPIFVVGDSGDDFNLATEFADTLVVLLINRLRDDEAGILTAIADWQTERKANLLRAVDSGESRILLQGCDENCGLFWPHPKTRLRGAVIPSILTSKSKIWRAMLRSGTKPADLINQAGTLMMEKKEHRGFKKCGPSAPYSEYVFGLKHDTRGNTVTIIRN